MTPTLSDRLAAHVLAGARSLGLPDDDAALTPTALAAHGDFQTNLAFRLAKARGENPRALAERFLAALPNDPALVASATVAGPGFINFKVTEAALAADVGARLGDDLGAPRPGVGKTLVIDFSSPNVAKRMHIGHLRSTIIGHALDGMFRFLGWRVIADNHIGDWGTQFGKLIVGWDRWRDDAAFAADPIGELQRIYQRFGEIEDPDGELATASRVATARLQAGDPELRALWRRFVDASMVEFDAVYARLGVRFDAVLGESAYEAALAGIVEKLLADGLAEVSDGAVVVRLTADDGPGLGEAPFLVRKADGAALYGTTDLATVDHRLATWAPDLIAYVTDMRQQLHFRQLFAVCRRRGIQVPFQHVGFGLLRLPGGKTASTKSGVVLNLVDVLDEAVARARAVVDQRSDTLSEDERAAIAETVGVAALKYQDLSQNPQSDIVFDWDKSLALDGNTAPYLLYAHARCRSVLRRAGDAAPGPVVLVDPSERELAMSVARTPDVIRQAAAAWRPNLLCDHLYGTTQAFSRFWERCRVVGADVPADVTASRLTLVTATATSLRTGLGLLGIRALDRM